VSDLLPSLYMFIHQWIVTVISAQCKLMVTEYCLCCCIGGALSYVTVYVVDIDRGGYFSEQ